MFGDWIICTVEAPVLPCGSSTHNNSENISWIITILQVYSQGQYRPHALHPMASCLHPALCFETCWFCLFLIPLQSSGYQGKLKKTYTLLRWEIYREDESERVRQIYFLECGYNKFWNACLLGSRLDMAPKGKENMDLCLMIDYSHCYLPHPLKYLEYSKYFWNQDIPFRPQCDAISHPLGCLL